MIEVIDRYVYQTKQEDGKFITINTGTDRKLQVSCNKTNVATGEQTTVLFTYQKYNAGTESWEDDNKANDPITVIVNDDKLQLTPSNGVDYLILSSDEPGTHTIKTDNVNIRNAAVEVIVNNA